MRVAMVLPVADWRQCGTAARLAEESGADCVQANELRHDPFAPLAFAALATERVQLATSVAIAFPRSPMIVANQAWDLHRHSGGRFVLGLGSQVRAHNERRFSTPWIAPAARMGEYVRALRAIFRCWEYGEPLAFEGVHYRFSLMTPEFTPPAAGRAPPPIEVAAVGTLMLKTAARVADGVRLHGFATRAWLEQIVRPVLAAELERAGKSFESFEVTGGGFIATGPDEATVNAAAEKVRARVAFYGSTPAYRAVLELHGLGELGVRLHALSREGRWAAMAGLISDDILDLFCARATYEGLAAAVERHFGDVVDTVTLEFAPGEPPAVRRRVIEAVRRIPSRFRAFAGTVGANTSPAALARQVRVVPTPPSCSCGAPLPGGRGADR